MLCVWSHISLNLQICVLDVYSLHVVTLKIIHVLLHISWTSDTFEQLCEFDMITHDPQRTYQHYNYSTVLVLWPHQRHFYT